jgi:Domain of unknown function (DUF309)
MPPVRTWNRRRHRPTYLAPYRAFVAFFNRGEFRACVDPLEALYFGRGRSKFYQGLIQFTVALLQLRREMARSPRVLLTKAHALLAPFAPVHRGLDVIQVMAWIEGLLAMLPPGAIDLTPAEVEALGLDALRLSLRGSRGRRYGARCPRSPTGKRAVGRSAPKDTTGESSGAGC